MFVIRNAQPAELDKLGEITVAAYEALDGVSLGPYADVLRNVADRVEHAEVLVAVEDGRLLGGVTYVPDARGPYAEFDEDDGAGIRMLAVDPAAQGRGLGAALVRACVDRARAAGRGRVLLHSTEAMQTAQRIYRRLGFRRTPERDRRPAPGLHLLGYELLLDPPTRTS